MAFGSLKKARKVQRCLDIPENMYEAPFDQIIAIMEPECLEDAVASHFEDILLASTPKEYPYYRLFPSWMDLLSENLETLMDQFRRIQEFRDLITAFPELAPSIYEFMLNNYLAGNHVDGQSITDDILIPMSDLERYQGAHFPIVRDYAVEILAIAELDNYAEMWDILQVLEQYFQLSRHEFEQYLHDEVFADIIDDFGSPFTEIDDDDIFFYYDEYDVKDLMGIFMDAEAYEFFMDNLPQFLKTDGLELYTMLIKILGPLPEIVSLHDACAEFVHPK